MGIYNKTKVWRFGQLRKLASLKQCEVVPKAAHFCFVNAAISPVAQFPYAAASLLFTPQPEK
jgi:hypothetical protein